MKIRRTHFLLRIAFLAAIALSGKGEGAQAANPDSLEVALGTSAFSSRERLKALPGALGFDYHPMPVTIAGSLESGAASRGSGWKALRLEPGPFSHACPNSLELHWRPGKAGAPVFIVLPGSFSDFSSGAYVNQTVAVLERAFPSAHMMAFSGFQTPQFLRGSCSEIAWDMRGLGRDLHERLVRTLEALGLGNSEAGLIGYSGGATLAVEILSSDSGTGRFRLGAAAFSPILDGPTSFQLLDDQYRNSTIVPPTEALTTWTLGTASKVIYYLLLYGRNAMGVQAAYRANPAEFVQRSYNQFTRVSLWFAVDAIGINPARLGNGLSYRHVYTELGFQNEIGVSSERLEQAFSDATEIESDIASVRSPLLIEYSKDDPILGAPIGQSQPEKIGSILSRARLNPNVTVFNPDYGGHAAAGLDPAFPAILRAFFRPGKDAR